MPHPNTTVHTVSLSLDYQDVMNKLQATASTLNVQKIERIQNPHLYQTYMLKKQKMDQDNGELRVNDSSSMEPEEKISAVSMHKVLTGALVDSLVSCGEYSIQPEKGRMNI